MVEENNNALKSVIESYKLLIKHDGEEFILRTENIKDFDVNENIIKAKKSLIEIEIKYLENELSSLKQSLKQYEGLFNVEDAGDSVIKAVNQISIDQVQLKNLIEKLREANVAVDVIDDRAVRVTRKKPLLGVSINW